jgi:3',5'-cyclic-AMP phosphodiesterase
MIRVAALALALSACVRPAEERTLADLEVGVADDGDGLSIEIQDGAAQVRAIGGGGISLWAQAPIVRAEARAEVASAVTLAMENCMPGAELRALASGRPLPVTALGGERPTVCRFALELPGGDQVDLELAPPDAGVVERFRFAAMGDIQTALPEVGDVFARIDGEPGLRFVVSMGDLVEDGQLDEYDLLVEKLKELDIPYFSTIGNHELRANLDRWHDLFGRYNVHFTFKGVAFSFVDSGNASIDPLVYDWLEDWLTEAEATVHIFGTHYPPIDPVGARQGSFRSRKEAAKLLAMLAGGAVDLTLYGHIHSYYAYSNAGIPAYISGGGGALPEKLDGIGRHFLVVEANPPGRVDSVGVVRVDAE